MLPAVIALACAIADPAIVSAHAAPPVQNGALWHYTITINVKNLGPKGQGSNVLQSVDVFQNGTKVDAKSVPPLAPGKAFPAVYAFDRADGAAPNTTRFLFKLDIHSPAGAPDCNAANDLYRLVVYPHAAPPRGRECAG